MCRRKDRRNALRSVRLKKAHASTASACLRTRVGRLATGRRTVGHIATGSASAFPILRESTGRSCGIGERSVGTRLTSHAIRLFATTTTAAIAENCARH